MSTDDTTKEESTADKPRLLRGVTECMTVIHDGGDVYNVTTESGREYAVDARDGRCTCPDAEYHLEESELCKHAYWTLVVRGNRVIPAGVDYSVVDPLLGCAVETTPLAVATDGGRTLPPEVAEQLTDEEIAERDACADVDDETHTRPDDCGCWDVDAGLPCWPCAREGFSTQNPAEPAADENGKGQ